MFFHAMSTLHGPWLVNLRGSSSFFRSPGTVVGIDVDMNDGGVFCHCDAGCKDVARCGQFYMAMDQYLLIAFLGE